MPGPRMPPLPDKAPCTFRFPPSTAPEDTTASPVMTTGVLVVPPCVLEPPLRSTEPLMVVGAVWLKLKLVLEAPVIAMPDPVLLMVVGPLKLTLEPEPAMPWLMVVEPPKDIVLPTPVTDWLIVAPLLKVMLDPCCPTRFCVMVVGVEPEKVVLELAAVDTLPVT